MALDLNTWDETPIDERCVTRRPAAGEPAVSHQADTHPPCNRFDSAANRRGTHHELAANLPRFSRTSLQ